jgi:hypothetical protein
MPDLELLLPQDWIIIPSSPQARTVAATMVEDVVAAALPASLPRDRAEPWRRELRRRLEESISEARARGARSAVLPLGGMGGAPVPGSILLTVLEDVGTADPEHLLTSLLADAAGEGTFVEIDGNPAVRIRQVLPGAPERGTSRPSVQIAYYLPHPTLRGVWGLLTITVISDGDPDSYRTGLYVTLFDAIATSARWSEQPSPSPEEFAAALAAARATAAQV